MITTTIMMETAGTDRAPGTMTVDYLRDPEAIYAQSFATVRSGANLARFPEDMAEVAVRMIHACGVVEIAESVAHSENAATAGKRALADGKPILVDANMVGAGIIRRHLHGNEIVCTLDMPEASEIAARDATTRSAGAVDLWDGYLDGAVAVFGNAPTALFRLLERIEAGAPKPAVVLGFPVGFVGAAESKAALAANTFGLEFITLHGRMGGSAIAAAAVNALAMGAAR